MATGRVPTTANSPLTAKGDLFTYSTAPARLAVGNNGETIVADSSTATGLRYQATQVAGKNAIINGDFSIWQRGTSFAVGGGSYTCDRFSAYQDASGQTKTISRQSFTPGQEPASNAVYFFRYAVSVAGTGGSNQNNVSTKIENVQTFAGQTVTFSFYAKADATRTLTPRITQNFGSGGSSSVAQSGSAITLTTSWARYSATFTMGSLSGKTIGTSSYLELEFLLPGTGTFTIDLWGAQLELGSVATTFQTATGTIQGELAACQRYYYEMAYSGAEPYGSGATVNSTSVVILTALPVSMRTVPTAVYTGTFRIEGGAQKTGIAAASLSLNQAQNQQILTNVTSSSLTAGWAYVMLANGASAIKLSSEL